jgi:predicted permease
LFGLNARADIDDELRDHLDSTIESLVAAGWSPDEARAEALRRFGNVSRVRSTVEQLDRRHHAARDRSASVESFFYDLRHAARGLRRAPVFTFVAALSIALGVAANTTVFSLVNAALLRPIPGANAERLARVYRNHHSPFDWREIAWFREHAKSFEHIVGERTAAMTFRAAPADEPERVRVAYVTRGYFPALGVRTALGRTFDVDEVSGASEPVVVLGYAFWQRRFAGDSSVIGKTVLLGGHSVAIAGVAAREFRSSVMGWTSDLFAPFAMAPTLTGVPLNDFGGSFYMTAKLARGASMHSANVELRVLTPTLARTDSARYERTSFRVEHVRGINAELRPAFGLASVFLMAMVGMVLLIACANVANLLLGRGAARRTEIGVRLAIGASRGRIIRQLLTESFLIAALGSALGFAIAWTLVRVIPAAAPVESGIDSTFFAPDHRVLIFTGLLCVATTLLFGALPAIRAASSQVTSVIKGDDVPVRRRRGGLVGVQAALCVVLLAVASLFLRSISSMQQVNPGFDPHGVVDVAVDLRLLGAGAKPATMFPLILQSAAALPGVESASLTALVPLSGSNMETRILPQNTTVTSRFDAPMTYFNVISPGHFANLRIPFASGRDFTDRDVEGSPRVAVIGETAARRLWPNASALGKRFHWGSADGPLVEVVGIVRDADYGSAGESPKTVVYLPLAQESRAEMTLQLRTSANVATVRRAVWDMLRTMAPALPPPAVVAMTDEMAITILPVRAAATLLGAFGALAMVLAAAGIYGVASYSVARRSREIGVRAALGATRGQLIAMVLWESGRRVGIGAIVGVVLTIGVGVALSRVLYGIRVVEPTVLLAVPVFIAVVAVAATLAPARKAAKANPVAAIRTE